jgi:polar amino acid transport system substrate-binding protein
MDGIVKMDQFFYKYLKFTIISIFFLISFKVFPIGEKELQFEGDIWCPYTCDESVSHQKGYVIDMAEEIFAKHNIKFTFNIVPWARVLLRSEKGEIDAMVAGYKEGRENKYIFPKEDFGKSVNKFYVTKSSNWFYRSPESLKNVTIGTILGYVYGGELPIIDKYAKKILPTGGESGIERNIKKLSNGEIDVTIEESNVTAYVLKQMKMNGGIREAGSFGKKAGVYIGFPKVLPNSKKYAQIVSDGIAELKKTGHFQKILKNYDLKMEP